MIEISFCDPKMGIYQKDIASNQEISYKYLDPIISSLKEAKLITKAAGKKSGYKLTRNPEKINMLQIYEAFEPGIKVVDCVSKEYYCQRRKICNVVDFWGDLNVLVSDYFISVTLADLQKKQ